jgi:hypothetical protein
MEAVYMTTTEEDLKRVNQHKDSWFREDGISLYTHYFDGLNGNRCGIYIKPFISIRGALTWDCITCPDCLKLKRPDEPLTVEIDTRGD